MSTVKDLIRGSMRLIGAVATGEAISADEASDGLLVLNDMIDSWSNESLIVFNRVRESFALTPSQSSYTIGPGGNFNTSRPQQYEGAAIEIPNGTNTFEIPMEILNLDQWEMITVKNTQSSIPRKMYAPGDFPLDTVNLWPVPNSAYNLILYGWKPLTLFATINDTVSLPPGYSRALRFNLALEIAPEYGKQPDQAVITLAMDAKANIKRMNVTPNLLATDTAISSKSSTFNWLTGE